MSELYQARIQWDLTRRWCGPPLWYSPVYTSPQFRIGVLHARHTDMGRMRLVFYLGWLRVAVPTIPNHYDKWFIIAWPYPKHGDN